MGFEIWGLRDFQFPWPRRPGDVFLGLVYGILLVYLIARSGRRKVGSRLVGGWAWGAMIAFAALLNAVFVVRSPSPIGLLLPDDVHGLIASPVLGVVPIALTAILGGPLEAVVVGVVSGVVRAGMGVGGFVRPLEMGIEAWTISIFVSQRYRGRLMDMLRRPVLAVPLGVLVGWMIMGLSELLSSISPLLLAIERAWSMGVAMLPLALMEAIAGGVIAEGVCLLWPECHPVYGQTLISPPWERSLGNRVLVTFLPLLLLGSVLLVGTVTSVAMDSATGWAVSQMEQEATSAASLVPLFTHTGATLIAEIARDVGGADDPEDVLREGIGRVPFFGRLVLLDADGGEVLSAYPHISDEEDGLPTVEMEMAGSVREMAASQGPEAFRGPEGDLWVSFGAPVISDGELVGVLIGRAELDESRFLEPLLVVFADVADGDGEGILIDEEGMILLRPSRPDSVGNVLEGEEVSYLDRPGDGDAFVFREAAGGELQLAYRVIVSGPSWQVIVLMPYRLVPEQAAGMALPLLAVLVMLVGALAIAGALVVGRIATQIRVLADAADRIADGHLEYPIVVDGEDEVGRLGLSLETMRRRLRRRLDELSLLLSVSRAVLEGIGLRETVPPILDGCLLATGADGARAVLDLDGGEPMAFAAGELAEVMAPLDSQVLAMVKQQGQVVIEHLERARAAFDLGQVKGRLGALVAMPLKAEHGSVRGVLWLAYPGAHRFHDEELAFLSALVGQAEVAIYNARLFEAARDERERLSAILAGTTDPILVTDRHDRLLLMNPAAEKLFGVKADDVRGRLFEDVIGIPALVELLHKPSADGASREIEVEGGRVYYANASWLSDRAGGGKVMVLRDITHLKELDEMKSQFVSTVSHDLRSPLTYMRGYATMIGLVGELNEKQAAYAEKILMGIDQMTDLIEKILDSSRYAPESGYELEREPCDISDVVRGVVSSHQAQAAAKNISLTTEIAPDLPIAFVDSLMIQRALNNLVDNAIKYTQDGGRVVVRAEVEGDRLILSVSDNGRGISQADQKHLFERFFRVRHKDTVNIKGSGLGLFIVRSIARLHGGDAWVKSRLGEGSTFYIGIPIRGDDSAPPASDAQRV